MLLFGYGFSDSDSGSIMQRNQRIYKTLSPDGVIFYEDFMTFVAKFYLSQNDERQLLTLEDDENVSFIRLLFKNSEYEVFNDTDEEVTLTIYDIGEMLRRSHGACKVDKISINNNEDEPDSKKDLQLKQLISELFSGIIANIAISTVFDGTCRNDLSKLIDSEHHDAISNIGNMSTEEDPLVFEDISKISLYDPPTSAFRG